MIRRSFLGLCSLLPFVPKANAQPRTAIHAKTFTFPNGTVVLALCYHPDVRLEISSVTQNVVLARVYTQNGSDSFLVNRNDKNVIDVNDPVTVVHRADYTLHVGTQAEIAPLLQPFKHNVMANGPEYFARYDHYVKV